MIKLTGYTAQLGDYSYPVFTMITKDDNSTSVIPNYSNIAVNKGKNFVNDLVDNLYPISRLDTFKYRIQPFDIFENPRKLFEYSINHIHLANNEYVLVLHELFSKFIHIIDKKLEGVITFDNQLKMNLNDAFAASRSTYADGRYKSVSKIIEALITKNSDTILSLKAGLLDAMTSTVTAQLLPLCGSNSISMYDAINSTRKELVMPLVYAIDKLCNRIKEYYIPSMYCGMFMTEDFEVYITPRAFNITDDYELEYMYYVDSDNKCLKKISIDDFDFSNV